MEIRSNNCFLNDTDNTVFSTICIFCAYQLPTYSKAVGEITIFSHIYLNFVFFFIPNTLATSNLLALALCSARCRYYYCC